MLISKYFQGDQKLEACLLRDAAHLTLGAHGDHVAKVQMALYAVDWIVIDRGELRSKHYGPSTANAVLKYKTKRNIINSSYQNKPDNVVGKMTIARLDKDLCLWEQTHRRIDDCACASMGLGGPAIPAPYMISRSSEMRAGNSTAKLPQYKKNLRIYCAITKNSLVNGGYNIIESINFAKKKLSEYGMSLSIFVPDPNATHNMEVIDYPDMVLNDEQVPMLRQASEHVRSGLSGIFRIIVCQRSENGFPGQMYRNVEMSGTKFEPFALLNSQNYYSNSSLLHEMIHASQKGIQAHDTDPTSVFANHPGQNGIPRTWLRPDHAWTLSRSFFAV